MCEIFKLGENTLLGVEKSGDDLLAMLTCDSKLEEDFISIAREVSEKITLKKIGDFSILTFKVKQNQLDKIRSFYENGNLHSEG